MRKFYITTFICLTALLTFSLVFIINNSEVILGDATPTIKSITVQNKNVTLTEEDQFKLEPIVTTTNNKKVNYTLLFSSDDTSIAKVTSKGVIKAIKKGTTKIRIKNNLNGKNVTITLKVNKKIREFTINCNNLLNVKTTQKIKGYLDGKQTSNLKYTSSNKKVATVDEKGNITTLKEGNVTIKVKSISENKTLSCDIKVEYLPKTLKLDKTKLSLISGQSIIVNATISPSKTKYKTVNYTSSNTNVVTVDSTGKLTGINPGNATITARGFNNVTATINVTVVEKNQNNITFFYQKNNVGDVILLSSNNHYALIDTGNPGETSIISNYLKNHNITTLDFVLITHAHDDHLGGLESLSKNFKIKKLYIKNYNSSSFTKTVPSVYTKGVAAFKNQGGTVMYINSKYKDGDSISFQDMDIKLYNTKKLSSTGKCPSGSCSGGNDNFNSVMELITVKGKKILLSADFYDKTEYTKYAKKIGKVDVLKLPHHGFIASGSNKDAFNVLNPKYSVVCNTNPDNKNVSFDKPTKSVINSLPKNTNLYYVFDYNYVDFSFKSNQDVILNLGSKR